MRDAFSAFAVATCGVLVAAGVGSALSCSPRVTASLLALAFLPYAALLVLPVGRARPALAFTLAAAAGLSMVLAPSILSDDVYRYLWDARVLWHGIDPYRYTPDSPALAALRGADHGQINHRDIATIYPPLAQLYFALAAAPWRSVTALKLVGLAIHLGGIALLLRVASDKGNDRAHAIRAAHLLGLNPLALSEAALGGHVDGAVGVIMLALAWWLRRGRHGRVVLAIGASAGLKLVGLGLWPLLLRRRPVLAMLALALSLAALMPLVGAGSGDGAGATAAGVSHYAQRWRGNEGLFALLSAAARATVDGYAGASSPGTVGPEQVAVPALRPLAARLVRLGLDPSGTVSLARKEARDPSVFDRAHLAGLLARAFALFAVLATATYVGWRLAAPADPALGVRAVLFVMLLLAPQLHPWYLAWLLPLELALGRRAAVVWSAAILAAYAPLEAWQLQRSWIDLAGTRAWQHGWVLCALCLEWWGMRAARRDDTARLGYTGPHVGSR